MNRGTSAGYASGPSKTGTPSRSGGPSRAGGFVSGGVHTYRDTARANGPTLRTDARGSAPTKPAAGLIQLQQGDRVEHTAFGAGTVVSVKPMGGDALAEVAFEGGTKKLMLKAAGKHMKKL